MDVPHAWQPEDYAKALASTAGGQQLKRLLSTYLCSMDLSVYTLT